MKKGHYIRCKVVRELSEPTQVYPFKRNISATVEQEKYVEILTEKKLATINLKFFIICLIVFLLSRVEILNHLWFFTPAFIAAAIMTEGRKYTLGMLLFSLLGLYFGNNIYFLFNGISITIVIIIVAIFRTKLLKSYWAMPILIFAGMTIIKSSLFLFYGFPNFYMVQSTIEGFIAGGLAFTFVKGFEGLDNLQKGALWNKETAIGIGTIALSVLISMIDINLFNVNLGRIIALILILAGIGSAIGIVVGFMPGLINSIVNPYAGFYALSGLLAGFSRGFGKPGSLSGFVIGQLFLVYFLFNSYEINTLLLETSLASIAFMAVPSKFWQKAYIYLPEETNLKYAEQVLLEKINEIKNIFSELSKTFRQVSDEIECENKSRFDQILKTLTNRVCNGCSVFTICWQKENKITRQQICTLFNLIEAQGKVNKEDLPGELRKRCIRPEKLVTVASCLYETSLLDKYYRKKLKELRNLVSQQLQGVSIVMESMAEDIKVEKDDLEQRELVLLKKIEALGIGVVDINLTYTSDESMEITLTKDACKGKMECNLLIKPFLEEYFNETFNVDRKNCARKKGEFLCECIFRPASALGISLGYSQVKSEGTVICGDNFKEFEIKGGKHVIALSDGMGVGPKAAKESNTVISLLEKLLTCGFEKDVAIKTINSVLGVRSEDETCATLDMVLIDIYTGKAEFIKIGAASGFIKRANQVGVIKPNTYPLGILSGVEIMTEIRHLHKGDMIILVSDGVLDAGEFTDKEDWMVEVLKDLHVQDPQEFAQMVLRHSLAVGPDIISDDMTVLVAKII
jgi:stage II sporulation protein E